MLGKVYKLVNSENDKVYIGITYRSLKTRFKQHLSDAQQGYKRPICEAIRDLGSDKFKIELICETEDLENKEIELIAQYNSFNKGYNATLGGSGGKLISCSREEVISLYKELNNASATARELSISKDTVLEIIKSHTNIKPRNPLIKQVKFNDKIFEGSGECAQYLIDNGILSGSRADIAHNINRVARGVRNSYKGLKFYYGPFL